MTFMQKDTRPCRIWRPRCDCILGAAFWWGSRVCKGGEMWWRRCTPSWKKNHECRPSHWPTTCTASSRRTRPMGAGTERGDWAAQGVVGDQYIFFLLSLFNHGSRRTWMLFLHVFVFSSYFVFILLSILEGIIITCTPCSLPGSKDTGRRTFRHQRFYRFVGKEKWYRASENLGFISTVIPTGWLMVVRVMMFLSLEIKGVYC